MKLRLMMGWCALAATVALGADVTGKNTCGLMNVPSDAEVTMISVPWVTVGGSTDAMAVANLVKTDTLSGGDALYYYDAESKTYYRWILTDGAWKPTATTKEDEDAQGNSMTVSAPEASYTLPRGTGLFLVRKDTTKEIWLYGQYSKEKVSVTVVKGAAGTPAYTMIANPNADAYDLNVKGVKGEEGDQILLDDAKTLYTYKTAKAGWTRPTTKEIELSNGTVRKVGTTTTDGCVVAPGRGAWYVSKGGAPTIEWN